MWLLSWTSLSKRAWVFILFSLAFAVREEHQIPPSQHPPPNFPHPPYQDPLGTPSQPRSNHLHHHSFFTSLASPQTPPHPPSRGTHLGYPLEAQEEYVNFPPGESLQPSPGPSVSPVTAAHRNTAGPTPRPYSGYRQEKRSRGGGTSKVN